MKILLGVTDSPEFILDDVDKIVWLEEAVCSTNGKKLQKKVAIGQEYFFCEQFMQQNRGRLFKETEYFCQVVLNSCCLLLNNYHGTDFQEKQWKLLLDYWIRHLVVSFYIKYIKLTKVVEEYGIGQVGIISWEEEIYYAPKEIVDFLLTAREKDSFCMRQYTDLAKWLGIPIYDTCKKKGGDEAGALMANAASKGKPAYQQECKVFVYQPYLPKEIIEHAVQETDGQIQTYPGIPFNHVFWTLGQIPVQYQQRAAVELNIQEADDFLQFLSGCIGKYIPVAYLEGFSKICSMAESYFTISPKIVLTAPAGLTHDDVFKAFLMKRQGQTSIYDVQHGGNYGLIDDINSGEREVSRRFYTFGWKEEKYGSECVPMPAGIGIPYLKKIVQTARQNKRYLYTAYAPCKYQISFGEVYTLHQLDQDEREFFDVLEKEVLDKLVVRNYACFRDAVNRLDFYRTNYPSVTLRNHLPFRKELMSAALLVAPSLDTTYLEAIWMGKPVVIFHSNRLYTPTKHAEKQLDALKYAGILHDSPKTAAQTLNQIKGCEMEWWMEKGRQEMISEFKDQYAFLPEDSVERWEKELVWICNSIV